MSTVQFTKAVFSVRDLSAAISLHRSEHNKLKKVPAATAAPGGGPGDVRPPSADWHDFKARCAWRPLQSAVPGRMPGGRTCATLAALA